MKLTDEMLKNAAPEAAEQLLRDLPEEPHVFSERFERQMEPLLADPERYARRRTRPLWRKALRTAACAVLACGLSLGALRAASPSAFAAVVNWAAEWYETHVVYRFAGAPGEAALPRYGIASLPEGFAETERIVMPNLVSITYENEAGEQIGLDYMPMEQGGAVLTVTEDMVIKEISVNGCPGQLYLSRDPEQSSAVSWMDEEKNICFNLNLFGNESDILHIAESVSLEVSTK